jgi:hypothetical protein
MGKSSRPVGPDGSDCWPTAAKSLIRKRISRFLDFRPERAGPIDL